ncbi:hypothetical protein FO519_000882 [Halicephalobus sp. NKZ332]|nr:hypothetical protein FO519_000882 [Halicephalobus sp. NKZ332]
MNKVKDFIRLAYSKKYLLTTNTITMCGIYGIADVIVQMIEMKSEGFQNVDLPRILRVSSIGLLHGPMNHYWYKFLDGTIVTGTHGVLVAKKVVADLSVSPFFTSTFIAGIATLEGKSAIESLDEYRRKFFQVLALDICVWPPAQSINFFFLPPAFRVLYVSFIVLIYTCFLTWIKHSELVDIESMNLPEKEI